MLNTIVGTFLGMNLVFMECIIAYGLIKKGKVRKNSSVNFYNKK